MESEVLRITTGRRRTVVDSTAEVAGFVAGRSDGLLSVFVPHATAGLAIIETGAGSDADLLDRIDALLPRDDSLYRHRSTDTAAAVPATVPTMCCPALCRRRSRSRCSTAA